MTLSLSSLSQATKRFHGLLLSLFVLVLIGALGFFLYSNIYQTLIQPQSLDSILTERKQTKILTSEYDDLIIRDQEWRAAPKPANAVDIFHR